MDIIKLLNDEIRAAKQAIQDKEKADAVRLRTEASEFKPVVVGLKRLASALSDRDDIEFDVSANMITARLGRHMTLEIRRYSHSKDFTVEETATYELIGDVVEHTHHTHIFDDAHNLLAFIVKRTAQYIASKET